MPDVHSLPIPKVSASHLKLTLKMTLWRCIRCLTDLWTFDFSTETPCAHRLPTDFLRLRRR
jgi:hypothetical protein